jgi:hypothetical protein
MERTTRAHGERATLNTSLHRHRRRRLPDGVASNILLNSNPLGIGRHASGVADPFNGHIDEFRISHVQRSDGWIETTWNNLSDSGAFAAAATEEQEGGEPPPLAGTGVVVRLRGEGERSAPTPPSARMA